ncbi:substrate-binding domain-containing protein [Loktanella sp. IMCC34160]|uniref:substrate-binding domain-containing protein n=1 Tax=Loktanella sp. IMCC34160 TaxID=2510646 RepID=UPI0013EACC81|nr:substrate-binding domain-containing protein [Loktanella sp. IMCC34160]
MSGPSNVERICRVLSAFDADNGALRRSDILKRAGIGRSTGYGLIRELLARGYLEGIGHGCFRLGPTARNMAQASVERAVIGPTLPGQFRRFDAGPLDLGLTDGLFELVSGPVPPGPPPWKIGFANASTSNPWRRALLASFRHGCGLHRDQIADTVVADAGDDASRQISQITEMLDGGVAALVVSAAPDPGGDLAGCLAAVRDRGVPLVAVDRRTGGAATHDSFVAASGEMIGKLSAIWMKEHLGGAGRVWLLSGLVDSSPAVRRLAAAREIFDADEGIVVEAVQHTGWTREGGQAEIARLLDTGHPPPDGVWCDSGLQGLGSMIEFDRRGLVIPPHTGGDVNGAYRFALERGVAFCAIDYPAAMGARAVEVLLDLLQGSPVPRRVEVPVLAVLPRGRETRSIKADVWAETYVKWDQPDEYVLAQGRGRSLR